MLVAGLMSGTSADGIDAALVEISGLGLMTRLRLIAFRSVPYSAGVRQRILAIGSGARVPAAEISQMNFLLGELFARACQQVCRSAGVPMKRLDLIGSHGQTIFHQGREVPYCGGPVRSTLQIGEPAVIAERTGVTTVADFRPADVAAGGQGAPLVPFFDYLFFRHRRKGRVALNIGGIANLTAIPAGGAPGDVIAFDTGPGNMLLDALTARDSGGKLCYDSGGRLASQGEIFEKLITRLLRQRYFRLPPPKTAGREQFGAEYLARHFLPAFGTSHQGLRDALATAAALTAESIARAVADFVLLKFPVQECFVSGGGVNNRFLMEQLQARLASRSAIRVQTSDAAGVPADAKEAVAFAVLAYHTFHRRPSDLCSATGARHPAILGKISYGKA